MLILGLRSIRLRRVAPCWVWLVSRVPREYIFNRSENSLENRSDYREGWGGLDLRDASQGILARLLREFILFAERMRGHECGRRRLYRTILEPTSNKGRSESKTPELIPAGNSVANFPLVEC